MSKNFSISFTVSGRNLTAVIHMERNVFVAECPEIGTVSEGITKDEALSNLEEATGLYIEEFPLE